MFINRRTLLNSALLAALGAGALSACGNAGSGNGKYRVAYIARAQADTFAAWLANEIKAAAEEFDDMTIEVFDGQAVDNTVNTLIENAISNMFDGIIIQPNNGEAQLPYVERCVEAGIKTITTNPKIDGIDGASTVDSNPYDQAKAVATLALDAIPKDAKVVVLNGPGGNFHSTERRRSWEEEFFQKRPDVTILAEDLANWNKDEAMALMEDWSLTHPTIDAVISMNDNMAAGAIEAVKGKAAFSNLMAYGVDGTPEACLLIRDGLMTATTLQDAKELAKLNVQAIHDLLTGAKEQVDLSIGNPVITPDNVDEYISMYSETGQITE